MIFTVILRISQILKHKDSFLHDYELGKGC